MKTPEEIAREAAEALVQIKKTESGERWSVAAGELIGWYYNDRIAREDCDATRRIVSAAVAAAVRRALTQCPVGSPLPDGRLEEIRGRMKEWMPTLEEVGDLFRHLDFLHRILADDVPTAAVREAERRGYERGWEEGAKAQHDACVGAARDKCESYGECWPNDVVQAVTFAPLAVPPEEG